MATRTLGIILHGATGRICSTQHLQNALAPIMAEGGLPVGDDVVMPRLLLVGRNEERLAEIARTHNVENWTTDLDAALADCNASAEAAVRIGHLRAEMVARGGVLVYVLMEMDRIAEAEKQAVRALAIARQLGAGRFEPFSLLNLSKIMILEDRRAEAVKNLEEAARISRETGITFLGAWVQGVLALAATDPAVRAEALGEGEEILRQDCVGHNYFWFYRDAMEASLEDADWDGVRRYAAALETYTKPEPLPWCDFFIARGRVLAAFGDGESNGAGGEATVAELRRLRDEAVRVGLKSAMTALDAALGAAPDTE